MIRKIMIFTTAAIFCLGISAACGEERETIHRTFNLGSNAEIVLSNVNGNIIVDEWDESHVDLEAIKKTSYSRSELDRIEIEIDQTGNNLRITTRHNRFDGRDDEGSFFSRLFRGITNRTARGSVDYTIRIPKSVTTLDTHTVNGNVEMDNVSAEIDAGSTNGSVIIRNASGYVAAGTTNGSVTISGSSSIRKASTTNGSVEVSIPPEIRNPVRLSTTNGSVRININTDMDANLNLRTTNGRVDASGLRMKVDDVSRRRIRGSMGAGGYEIDASTVNGDIIIRGY